NQNGCSFSAAVSNNASMFQEVPSQAGNNTYHDNYGISGYVLAPSGNSVILNDPQADSTAATFRAPLGTPGGIAGGLALNQLIAPLNAAKGVATTCTGLSAATYFYKITALDNFGETTGSTEVSYAAGGVNGCFNITWTKVPGA